MILPGDPLAGGTRALPRKACAIPAPAGEEIKTIQGRETVANKFWPE